MCKAFTYARVLSGIGQHFATDFPLRVLAVATGFSGAPLLSFPLSRRTVS